jgi:tetratricopeptide (TPR) repeat protein
LRGADRVPGRQRAGRAAGTSASCSAGGASRCGDGGEPSGCFRADVEPPAGTAQPGAPAPAAKESDAGAQRHKEIVDFHRELKTKNHFEVLGISRGATEAQIREGYFLLVKRYHPDVYRGPGFTDVADEIEAILVRLGEAFEVLKDPARRGQYEALLASREPRPAPVQAAGTAAGGPDAAGGADLETRLADEAVRKAEKLYTGEKYWDAIQAVEPHFAKTRGKMRVRASLVLARCYLKNPNWVKRAEEQLNLAIEDDPKCVDAHCLLGAVYLAGGLKSRALSKFRKVLELNPEHEEARARVTELTPPPETAAPANPSFMKRIFGKGTEE